MSGIGPYLLCSFYENIYIIESTSSNSSIATCFDMFSKTSEITEHNKSRIANGTFGSVKVRNLFSAKNFSKN